MKTKSAVVKLEEGVRYPLRIEYFQNTGYAGLKLEWVRLENADHMDQAVECARQSDIAVVFAGLSDMVESEGWDRKDLEMPFGQDELISRVAAVNPNIIVVLINGSPVSMNKWIVHVPAVIEAWYPGQECGNALTDILFGDVNPSGKLPFTYPIAWEDCPAYGNYPGSKGEVSYEEDIFVGYRYFDKKGIAPLFPFGHGLSYTSFGYSDMKVEVQGKSAAVSFRVKNTGACPGAEVAQIYVSDIQCSAERPPKELKGFAKVYLEPGEEKEISVILDKNAFSFYNPQTDAWMVEPGQFEILAGSSSQDIRLRQIVTI